VFSKRASKASFFSFFLKFSSHVLWVFTSGTNEKLALFRRASIANPSVSLVTAVIYVASQCFLKESLMAKLLFTF
jgi:hypothetical protein